MPAPGPGQVLVRVQAAGVCGSDLFLQKGAFGNTFPRVPGHEAAGVVAALGSGVGGLSVGDQVALYYIQAEPGSRFAAQGRPNIGPGVQRMGVDVDGAFAEYVVRPAETLIPTTLAVPPEALAVLTDAVATPYHAIHDIARVSPGQTVLVLGIGGIGSNAVQIARAAGATVIAMTRSPAKLHLAASLGAEHLVVAGSGTAPADVRALTGGDGPDVVLQCAGSAALDEFAVEVAGHGGKVVLVGASTDRFAARSVDLIWRELAVLGSRGFTPQNIRDVVALYGDGRIRVDHLTDHLRPLAEADAALEDLRTGRTLRTVLVP